jgi:hypothetical protein
MSRDAPTIHFVMGNHATHWRDIETLHESDIDRHPHRFVGGRNSWIAQTYLRMRAVLRDRGWRVGAGGSFVHGAICLAHRDDANDFRSDAHASFLVVVRADRAPVVACDLALVQNGLAPTPRERFVPLWPQPGLNPRDAGRRGIRRIAYLGRTGAAPWWFRDGEFHRALNRRGVTFDVRRDNWDDYRAVDVALASRDESATVLATKPATKLYNAWLAGVPMLAAPEPAYREARCSPIDFIEVSGARDVLQAIDLLRANPRLYEAMVANGRRRGAEFGVDAIRDRWTALLEREIVPAFERTNLSGGRRAWHLGAMLAQKALSRVHRARVAIERSAIRRNAGRSAERAPDHFAHVPGQPFGAAD